MRYVGWLFPLLLWGQYRVKALVSFPSQDTISPVQLEMFLSFSALRYDMKGSHREKVYSISYLFSDGKAYLIDHQAKKAYLVTPTPPSPLPLLKAVFVRNHQISGYQAEEWKLDYPDLQLRVIWTRDFPFEWKAWDRFLEPDRIGAAARYFEKGIPLLIEQYEKGLLTWVLEVQDIQPYKEPLASEPPYPLSPWIGTD
ncbi:MAG: hypothetical protein NZ989_08545 [Bacteroidia bacterium]|nr:hypothetical protein [Bacteroidia bacterium]MDW8058217.1 hypothetical protein [Bacteroidia bacterium]